MPAVNPATIRPGSRVKLRGPDKDRAPKKPYPLGWRKVSLTDAYQGDPPRNIVVTGDERWIPIELVIEVKGSE
jgi:hypothetical protein